MDATQKKNRIARAERHAEHDLLISGEYIQRNGETKGCSVGCDAIDIQMARGVSVDDLTDDGCHAMVAEHDGTPEWLELLRDTVFEGLNESDRQWWHVELAKSLPETEDWQPYFHKICIRILEITLEQKDTWQDPYAKPVVDSIALAIEYHKSPTEARRSAAAESAESAARSAAESAESAAESARSAARSAAWSAAWSAESAAWSAAWSAESAESARFKSIADAVISIFKEDSC